jgi:hypothetical protein
MHEMTVRSATALDSRDQAMIAARLAARQQRPGPKIGDFVYFADGAIHRIADLSTRTVHTTAQREFYLGAWGCEFLGEPTHEIPSDSLARPLESAWGSVWIFHHDHPRPGNSVVFDARFEVYSTAAPASEQLP